MRMQKGSMKTVITFDLYLQDLEKQDTTVYMGDGCSKYSTE